MEINNKLRKRKNFLTIAKVEKYLFNYEKDLVSKKIKRGILEKQLQTLSKT
jgi:hypothetical protein